MISRFLKDESGAFAMLFGLMALVLVAMTGAVVDYTGLEEKRNRAQIALDAAALALQPRIYTDTPEQIRAAAAALVAERLNDPSVNSWINVVDIDIEEGTLDLRGGIGVPMNFVRLVGFNHLDAGISAQVTRKKLALEVAMVLDNSGSMLEQSRMTYLKQAAACAVDTLFYDNVDANCRPVAGARLLDNVKMSVVPFTMYVNVGANNANQPWIDRAGNSVIARHNFDNDDRDTTAMTAPVNRLALYDRINNDSWRGCVESRPHTVTGSAQLSGTIPEWAGAGGHVGYLDTDDTVPNAANPNTLFVPLFAPDLPETLVNIGVYNNYTPDSPASCDRPTHTTNRCEWTNVTNRFGQTVSSSYTFQGPQNTTVGGVYFGPYPRSCDCRAGWQTVSTSTTGSGNNQQTTTVRRCNTTYIPTGLTQRELQERMCKYSGNITHTTNQKGPNADCPHVALLPLTDNPTTVKSTINAMVADGGTNIHEGTAWGLRTLTPTQPFPNAAPYDEATSKVLIVMTDGENTSYKGFSSAHDNFNGSVYFSAYGYPYNNPTENFRLGAMNWTNAQIMNEMDRRTLQSCAVAKQRGMTVYTIGLAVQQTSRPAAVRTMLTTCASQADYAYFPAHPTELNDVFASIAQQLAALRISR